MDIQLTKSQIYDIKSFLAFVLRHKPYFYHVKLDSDGFADIYFLSKAIKKAKGISITSEQIVDISKRFSGGIFSLNIDSKKIRAKSGHTVIYNTQIAKGFEDTHDVPNLLYAVVDKEDVNTLISNKIITFSNKLTTLSASIPTVIENSTILTINASKAISNSVKFLYNKDQDLYYVRLLSSEYISLHV